MGSTSTSPVPGGGSSLEDDLGLIDLERLAQSGDFSGVTGPELREWCGATSACSDTDSEEEGTALQIHALLDAILHQEKRGSAEKQKLDSRTFVRSKRRSNRPGLHALLRDPPACAPAAAAAPAPDKFLTYNKYTSPAFRLDAPRASDPEPEAAPPAAEAEAEAPHALSRPIDIDLSQPASHLAFTRGVSGAGGASERDSFSMFRSGTSFLNMSPPSLVSSVVMDSSLQPASADAAHPDNERSARESLEPQSLLTSMTLSIMEEKDMSTSFLSQSTCHERDSLIGSLPPSMPSSVDSSFRLTQRPRADLFTVHPRADLMNETVDLSSSSDAASGLNLRRAKKDAAERGNDRTRTLQAEPAGARGGPTAGAGAACKQPPEHNDLTRTFHSSFSPRQNGPKTSQNESSEHNSFTRTFKKATPEHNGFARTFRRDSLGSTPEKAGPEARPALHLALDKRELSEIVRARRQLSLARSALPTHTFRASEEAPRRNATLKKHSPQPEQLEATIIYVKEDAPDAADRGDAADTTLQHQRDEWGQRCAMVGSSDSTDTATLSSSSPPDVPDDVHERNARRQEMSLQQVASTPLGVLRHGGGGKALLLLHHNISPIYGEAPVTAAARPARRDRPPAPSAPPAPPARRSALPTSKLRQYSSHKELSRIPGGAPAGAARGALGRAASARRGVYASNPALSPTAPSPPALLQRRDSYTISVDGQGGGGGGGGGGVPALVRQGTETLRRPHSQLPPRRDTAGSGAAPPVTQQRVRAAPHTHPALRHPAPGGALTEPQPARGAAPPPRASRLPAPRRCIRPPSVYSVAPERAAEAGERY